MWRERHLRSGLVADASDDETPGERLARYVKARMAELGLSSKKTAAAGGPSRPTLQRILAGEAIERFDAKFKLARVLGWTTLSVDRILDGGEPILLVDVVEPVDWQDAYETLRGELDEVRSELAQVRRWLTERQSGLF